MNLWDEKIECIEKDGKFMKVQEIYHSVQGWKWYATKKLSETKRFGFSTALLPENWGEWDVKELIHSKIAKKITRKHWYKDELVKMVYESDVTRD